MRGASSSPRLGWRHRSHHTHRSAPKSAPSSSEGDGSESSLRRNAWNRERSRFGRGLAVSGSGDSPGAATTDAPLSGGWLAFGLGCTFPPWSDGVVSPGGLISPMVAHQDDVELHDAGPCGSSPPPGCGPVPPPIGSHGSSRSPVLIVRLISPAASVYEAVRPVA